jgi:hypothetical protein
MIVYGDEGLAWDGEILPGRILADPSVLLQVGFYGDIIST